MSVGVLLLAAGSSARFGSDKRMASLTSGGTMLGTTIEQILTSQLPLRVCLRGDDSEIARILCARSIPYVLCQRSHQGMGATLSEGILDVSDWDGALIALADMPLISPNTYLNVARTLRPDTICLPINEKGRGHPVGFGRKWFDDLQALSGDRGAFAIVNNNENAVVQISCNDENIQRDIDLSDNMLVK